MTNPTRLARLLAVLLLLSTAACASLIERTPDRTPWGGYARETGRIVNGGR